MFSSLADVLRDMRETAQAHEQWAMTPDASTSEAGTSTAFAAQIKTWLTALSERAALSASRTAQAPQQELARTTLICAAHMLDACAENMQKLCVGYGAEQMRGIAQRLREGTPTLEQACTADDLKKAQARIQVLETSVDYLRYLVDHPVKQETTTVPQQGTRWKDKAMERFVTVVGVSDTKVSYRNEASGRLTVTRKPSFMHIFERADPPVAPAEGEQ